MYSQDIFHIGKITRVVGNAFSCSRDENWEEGYETTPSGISTGSAYIRYSNLVNREGA